MGLEEKRTIAEAKEKWIPQTLGYIEQMSTAKPEFDIDWDTFTDMTSIKNFQNNGLGRVWEGIRDAARDDFSKEAIKDGLKKIVMKNVETPAEIKVHGAKGVLTVDACYAKSEYAAVSDIQKAVENML